MTGELENIAVAVDELGNALTGGSPRWTISARCWYYREQSRIAAFMVWLLNFVQKDHCRLAYERMIALDQADAGGSDTGA